MDYEPMTYEQNVRAILEYEFSNCKDEVLEAVARRISDLQQTPTTPTLVQTEPISLKANPDGTYSIVVEDRYNYGMLVEANSILKFMDTIESDMNLNWFNSWDCLKKKMKIEISELERKERDGRE